MGNNRRRNAIFSMICAAMTLLAPGYLGATEFPVGDAQVTTKATVTAGTAVRATSRDPGLLPPANAATLGVTGTAVGGRNSDDADLNFDRGDRVSTVLKGVAEAEVKYRNLGAFLRAKAWYDYTLADEDRPWGNIPNGYAAGRPLSDHGFAERAKFSGAALQEAYVYGSFTPGDRALS